MIKTYYQSMVKANNLRNEADKLNNIKNQLINLKSEINENWKADEVKYINNFIIKIQGDLTKAYSQCNSLANEIDNAIKFQKQDDEYQRNLLLNKQNMY